MTKFQIVPGVTYANRNEWRASQLFPRRGSRVARSRRTEVFIHHTVIIDSDASKNLWETETEIFQRMRNLQTIRPDLGNDVPYNFVIFLMNTNPASIYVCEGRGEDRSGAHTLNHNISGIGIALQGDFENYSAPVADYTSLISFFLGWLKFDPNGSGYGGPYSPMSNLGAIRPHQDVSNTDCPGKNVINVLSQLKFADPRNAQLYLSIDVRVIKTSGTTTEVNAGVLVGNRSYVDLDLVIEGLGREPDPSIDRVKQGGVVYIRAASLLPFLEGVQWDANTQTVTLEFRDITPNLITNFIMSGGRQTTSDLTTLLDNNNSAASGSFARIADLYISEGSAEGVNSDIAFCQMCLETGYLRFGGDVSPEQNNFAGLGATGGGLAGASFSTVQEGVRAHIQHLKAYASTDSLNNPLVDPRFDLVTRGSAPTIDELTGKWAVDREYGFKIKSILRQLFNLGDEDEDLQA